MVREEVVAPSCSGSYIELLHHIFVIFELSETSLCRLDQWKWMMHITKTHGMSAVGMICSHNGPHLNLVLSLLELHL